MSDPTLATPYEDKAGGSPFHAGEMRVQERLGVRDRVEAQGRKVIRDHMPDQHRDFFAKLPFILVGSLDADRRPWASMLVGAPGFIGSPDPRHLTVRARPVAGDPLEEALRTGAPLGLLGIELETRRRNRLNGTITSISDDGFELTVGQSFGNCPQYIQTRQHRLLDPGEMPPASAPRRFGPRLPAEHQHLVRQADTFFIATAAPGADGSSAVHGVDVSHRGGRPGFVGLSEEDGATILTAPDFLGNFHFNTFGNLELNPVAGLLFVDFATGDILTLTGTAEVVWDGPDLAAFAGAMRLLRFRLSEGFMLPGALPLRWGEADPSPLLAGTGNWDEVAATRSAMAARTGYRDFNVVRIDRESESVKSFTLEPADGQGLIPHLPGQFLPIEIPDTGKRPVRRTYTLSHAANGRSYRISVKREAVPGRSPGVASNHLHDHVRVGSVIRALAPRGSFTLDTASGRPVLLLSGGIGITPMMAIADALLGGTTRTRVPNRRVHFVHGVRNGADHAFRDMLRTLAERHRTFHPHVRYSDPRPQDVQGLDFDSIGIIDTDLLRSLLPLDDYDIYLCGPPGFMQAQYDNLRRLGVRDSRIRAEAFGPASLVRTPEENGPADPDLAEPDPAARPGSAAEAPTAVTFARSGRTAMWSPGAGSLLELAEAAGIDAPFGCRSGACGTCRTAVLGGGVHHLPLTAEAGPGEALICSAVPAAGAPPTLDL